MCILLYLFSVGNLKLYFEAKTKFVFLNFAPDDATIAVAVVESRFLPDDLELLVEDLLGLAQNQLGHVVRHQHHVAVLQEVRLVADEDAVPGPVYPRSLELRLQLLVELAQFPYEVVEVVKQEPGGRMGEKSLMEMRKDTIEIGYYD